MPAMFVRVEICSFDCQVPSVVLLSMDNLSLFYRYDIQSFELTGASEEDHSPGHVQSQVRLDSTVGEASSSCL